MSDQTTRPAPAALSEARLAELRKWCDENAKTELWCAEAAAPHRAGARARNAEKWTALAEAVAELSRLRAGLTQAPELIKKLRCGTCWRVVLTHQQGGPVCGRCLACCAEQAADLLSALLPQDDTRKEPTNG